MLRTNLTHQGAVGFLADGGVVEEVQVVVDAMFGTNLGEQGLLGDGRSLFELVPLADLTKERLVGLEDASSVSGSEFRHERLFACGSCVMKGWSRSSESRHEFLA